MSDYSSKLRDPRWQKKRLEIMERDGFKCKACLTKSDTLHVHHGYYGRGMAPWEYEDSTLITLCDKCHDVMGKQTQHIHRVIAACQDPMIIITGASGLSDTGALIGYLVDALRGMSNEVDHEAVSDLMLRRYGNVSGPNK